MRLHPDAVGVTEFPVSVHIKICGITCLEDAENALRAGASAIGCNLVPASPRFVDVETARKIFDLIGDRALSVLVVADRTVAEMRALREATGAKCFQLHGDETNDVVRAMLPHAYKAVRVGTALDVERATEVPGDHVLVDAKVSGKLGGTGLTVDFGLVAPLARVRNVTLAGGLHPGNVALAIARVRPFCVDVASGVEIAGDPRRKDASRMLAFREAVTRAAETLDRATPNGA